MAEDLPFKEAIAALQRKGRLPNNLTSAQLRQIYGALLRQNIFSARTADEHYLDEIARVTESIVNPMQADRGTGQTVTEGFNPATARAALRDYLRKSGYTPEPGQEGTIKDLASDPRLQLVVKTNVQLAQGAGNFIQVNAPDAVQEAPAMELVRFEDRMIPRGERRGKGGVIEEVPEEGWPARWQAAAEESGDDDAARVLAESGRMVALKGSPLWDSLGNGAGGFDDGLGNPFPPFAFNSGMWWQEVTYAECVELGLIDKGDTVTPHPLSLTDLFKMAAGFAFSACFILPSSFC